MYFLDFIIFWITEFKLTVFITQGTNPSKKFLNQQSPPTAPQNQPPPRIPLSDDHFDDYLIMLMMG